MAEDTIFALSSAPGRAGIAVIRISGPRTFVATAALTATLPKPRLAALRTLRDPATGEMLDRAVVLCLPGPGSFTGEDVAELHLHGSAAVIAGVFAALVRMAGLRPAEAGEFTARAFHNGRLDLAEAEGLGDLIAAETAGQRRQALAQAGGALSQAIEMLRDRLVEVLAQVEAALDFPDEDLPPGLDDAARHALGAVAAEIARLLAGAAAAERVRDGMAVALLGAPNAGKSSLLNALAGSEVAIVSPVPGTTRDVVTVRLEIGGQLVTVSDTAGLRDGGDALEQEGMRRAALAAEAADLRVAVVDLATEHELATDVAVRLRPQDLVFLNKSDLAGAQPWRGSLPVGVAALRGAALTGEGVADLVAAIGSAVSAGMTGGPPPLVTRARHVAALREAGGHVAQALAASGTDGDLLAEDLRLALRALGRITGRVDAETVLDAVFARFCIGK